MLKVFDLTFLILKLCLLKPVCLVCFYWLCSADLTFSPSFCAYKLKTSVKKEFWVSVIHFRNFSDCRGDRWDSNTDSINKINPSAPINCISACLLSLSLFSSVQTDGNLSRQCYIGLIVYLLADKFIKSHGTLSSCEKVTNVLSLSSLCQLKTTQCTGTAFALELHTPFLVPSEQYLCTYTCLGYSPCSSAQFQPQQVKKAFKRATQISL